MGGPGTLDWLFWIGGAFLALAGTALGTWALFWDRSRGRRRCPRCWYSMEGAPAAERDGRQVWTCPECGHAATDPRRLLQTRRHPRWAGVAALLLIVGYLSARFPASRTGGWTAVIPSTLLIVIAPAESPLAAPARPRWAAPVATPPPPTLLDSLTSAAWRRIFSGDMAAWQSEFFIDRFISSSKETLAAIQAPKRWLRGEAIPVRVTEASWWQGSLQVRSERSVAQSTARNGIVVLPGIEQAPLTVRLDLQSRRRTVVYRQKKTAPVHLVDGAVELVNPVDTATANELVRQAIDAHLVWSFDDLRVMVEDRSTEPRWEKVDFWLAYRVDVVFDGGIVGTTHGDAMNTPPLRWKNWRTIPVHWAPGGRDLVRGAPEHALLVVTGDPLQTLRWYWEWPFDGPPPEVWTGTFEIPVRLADPALDRAPPSGPPLSSTRPASAGSRPARSSQMMLGGAPVIAWESVFAERLGSNQHPVSKSLLNWS